jgi:hypothetical protein
LFGGVDDVIAPGTPKGRSFGTDVAHLCLPEECHNTEMVFDPSDLVVDYAQFELPDWTSSEFGHVQGKEELPHKMPEPRGQGVVMCTKVDADRVSDTVTRRSRTGFLVYLKSAPIS